MRDDRSRAAWKHGRLDGGRGPSQLLFGHMYEDAEIEARAFRPGSRVFCIASAGCTAIELSRRHSVMAVDINPAQVEYARSRAHGGASTSGRVERGMSFLRGLGPSVGWTRARLHEFLELSDPVEQTDYWRQHLDTSRFRAAMDFVLSPPLLRLVYARPFLQALPPRFGRVVRARLERGLGRHPNRANSHARALFLGETDMAPTPSEARHIEFACADAAEFLERSPARSFDGFTLSNILDGAGGDYAARLWNGVRGAARSEAVVVIRSFAEPSALVDADRAGEDRSMIWGTVAVRSAEAAWAGI